MDSILKKLLSIVSDMDKTPEGAYNIRENGLCAGRASSEHVKIESKTDKPGINIYIDSAAKGEKVYIPACVTHSNVDDLVYNDFFVEDGADVVIVAGCGVHTEGEGDSQHNGIHSFFIGKGARVSYLEKHIGTGKGTGKRIINPKTVIEIAEGGYMEMDSTQIGGVDSTLRETSAKLKKDAHLVIREKILTDGLQTAQTDFSVDLDGENSSADIVSRSVAKGESKQLFRSVINGNTVCSGHSECDSIIMDNAQVSAVPELTAKSVDAALIHEAAIGKIAGEQIIKLMTLGLTEQQAEQKIIEGFLK